RGSAGRGLLPASLSLALDGAARATAAAWRVAAAQWWLRRCRRGHLVRTRGRPLIEGRGEIVLGDGVAIWSHLQRTQLSAGPGARLVVGERTFINTGTSISARASVTIGRRCQIANHVVIMDSDFHGLQDRDRPEPPAPIVIEDDVWIAVRATVLKGVRIGAGAVVAAGAVVVRDVAPRTLVAGVPAREVARWDA
ncbi:MAG TPA: acyltransferase, partial [Planctomycetota bacterium]|nr:acyltransferase [Planctomycetota bacterium]